MSRIFEKTIDSIGTLFSPLGTSLGLQDMFERCFYARTKREEEWIIIDCLRIVKAKLSEPSNKPSIVARCLAFVIFSKMLGYKSDFAHIHAVKLAQLGSLKEKKMGYLASDFLLSESDALSVLLVNTIVRDLGSRNIVIVAMALSATCHLIPSNQAPTVLPLLAEKLNHPSAFVRSKAVIALHHFLRLCPQQCCHYISNVKTLLGDKDPGVVALVLQFLIEACEKTPGMVTELAPILVQIQRQILDGKLPPEYTYRGLHAPWMQISVLRLLQLVDKPDSSVESVVEETLSAARPGCGEAVGAALVCECVSTLVQFRPSEKLLALAMDHVSQLLNSNSNNLRYAGLSLLEVIVGRYQLSLSPEQQQVMLASLQHLDHAVKRKTLNLLCVVANEHNAESICKQVINYAQEHCGGNPHLLRKFVCEAVQLTDKFPNSKNYWHVAMLLRLLPLADQTEAKTIQNRIKKVLLTDDDDNISAARYKVFNILKKYSESKTASISILEVYVWALSHFNLIGLDHIVTEDSPEVVVPQIIALGQKVLRHQKKDSSLPYGIRDLLISIVQSLSYVSEHCSVSSHSIIDFLEEIKLAAIGDSYMRECCEELLSTLPHSQSVSESLDVFNKDESVRNKLDFTLSFLDGYVCGSLKAGGQPYVVKLPKVDNLRSSVLSPGPESLELPTGMSAALTSSCHSPVSSERSSWIGSFSSEDLKSWPLHSDQKESHLVKTVWTKEGRVKDSNPSSPREFEVNNAVVSADISCYNFGNLSCEPLKNEDSDIVSSENPSLVTAITRDPLEELLHSDFQTLSVNLGRNS